MKKIEISINSILSIEFTNNHNYVKTKDKIYISWNILSSPMTFNHLQATAIFYYSYFISTDTITNKKTW